MTLSYETNDLPPEEEANRTIAELDYSPVRSIHDGKHVPNPKSDPVRFFPMPSKRRRTMTRWVLFGVHLLPFVAVILLYPAFNLSSNTARMALGIWALVLLAHLILAALLDFREGVVYARKDRRYRRQIDIQLRRSKMLETLYGEPDQSSS